MGENKAKVIITSEIMKGCENGKRVRLRKSGSFRLNFGIFEKISKVLLHERG